MFKIDDKSYAIDLKKLMEWVSSSPSSERNIGTTITQIFPIMDEIEGVTDETLATYSTKEITENKDSLNDVMNNIRYDIIKFLISTLLNTYNDFKEDLTWQQKMCFNTLLKHGIIIEIKEK